MNTKHSFSGVLRAFVMLVTGFFLAVTPLRAAIETGISSKSGSQISTGAILTIQDQWFAYMAVNTIHNSMFYAVQAKDNVVLRFDQSKMNNYQTSWSLTVGYTIDLYNESSTLLSHLTGQSLTINYDNAASYKDKDVLQYTGQYYYARLTVTSVSYSGSNGSMNLGNYSNDIFLDLEQETERYYEFISPSVPPVVFTQSVSNQQLPVSWDYSQGAENYDLEWLFLDLGERGFSPTGGYDFDFRDATRINTTEQHYNIPLAYPRGILLYRVRGVGIDGATGDRVEGDWSYNNSSWTGSTSTIPGGSNTYRLNYVGLDSTYNWQYSAGYAEDGKRKEMISYFDGSLRNRQTSTILNTENNAVVAETKYDFEGRGAAQMMPTPLTSTGIHYYNAFNENFDKNDFDDDGSYSTPATVTTGDQTGLYYSNYNLATGTDAFTPDAEGYPFARSTYKRDGTGRIRKQSGVGADMTIGSGHETQYFYGTPGAQQELDRLFGNEAGLYAHYKKNMVLDPNGQVSITYLDQEGRTVATALAGEPPANLLAIDFKPVAAASISEDMLYGKNNQVGDAMVSQSTLTVSTAGTEYDFEYNLVGDEQCATCEEEICKTCKYDLEINIADEDNNPVTFTVTGVGAQVGTYTVSNISSQTALIFSATFSSVGTYSVTKTLRLNEASFSAYYNEMVEALKPCAEFTEAAVEPCYNCQDICVLTYKKPDESPAGFHYEDLDGNTVDDYVGLLLIADCKRKCENPIVEKDECELKYAQLAADMSPGGQYFDNHYYDPSTHTFHTPDNSWLTTHISSGAFGAFLSQLDDDVHCHVPTAVSSGWDWDDVRANWQPCFAQYLINYHPEYCQYNFNCQRILCAAGDDPAEFPTIGQSNTFDQDMEDFNSGGLYYNPTEVVDPDPMTSNPWDYVATFSGTQLLDPYFDPLSYAGCEDANLLNGIDHCGEEDGTEMFERAAINDLLTHYILAGISGTPVPLSIWYVLEDPSGIAGTANPTAASAAAGFTVGNNILQLFHNIHGYGSNPGLLGGTAPLMTKYQYFTNAYLGIKKLVQYKRYRSDYAISGHPEVKCDPLVSNPTNLGWTDEAESFQIRYVDAFPLALVWATTCHQEASSYGHLVMEDAVLTALEPVTEGSGGPGTITFEAYKGTCSAYAWKWIKQLHADCPGIPSFANSDTTAIKEYMIEICAYGSDPINAVGASSCNSCNVAGPGACVFNSFADIRDCYAAMVPATCTTTVVHPPLPVINQQVTCSCENYAAFISDQGLGGASDAATATAINDYFMLTGADVVTGTEVGNWETECALTSGHALSGLTHIPTSFMCPATSILEYNESGCSCTNINNYIATLQIDNPSITNSQIALALNEEFHPATDFVEADVVDWRDKCDNATYTSTTFDNLPGMLRCLSVDECTRNSLYSFLVNHGFAEPPTTYGGPDQAAIVAALNTIFHPAVTLVWSDVDAWLTACSSNTYTSTTFDNLPDQLKCNQNGMPPPPCNCEIENIQSVADAAYMNNMLQTASAIAAANEYMAAYRAKCLNTLARETMTVDYILNEYYYTLYYYDQAGNLIKTVPPQGVELLTSGTTPSLDDVKDYRANEIGSSFSVPPHKMVTHYKYNSLQQLMSQSTPDAGGTNFYYDRLGRLSVSQNAKQATSDKYSYTYYDELGRIYEVGQFTNTTAISSLTNQQDSTVMYTWFSVATANEQITRTYYDDVPAVSTLYGTSQQENLRGRVAMVSYTDLTGASTYDHASHYSYDEHGNVKTLVQENTHLEEIEQDLKYIDYEYDLVSGNVNSVAYQNHPDAGGNPMFDRFYHKYLYDADNRITQVFTSTDNVIWKKEAKYFYYAHGPLARTELGDQEVQGADHVYTLQGWLKGVNSNTLDNTKDPGKDAYQTTNLNKMFGTDVTGYTLGYFSGDYTAKKTAVGAFEASISGSSYLSAVPGLYNGNISMMGTTITDADAGSGTYLQALPQISGYAYDQLNRIREATSYTGITSNAWTNTASGDRYKESFHYDLNGNIYSADRYSQAGTQFDGLSYRYYNAGETSSFDYSTYPGTPIPSDHSNKLERVVDGATSGTVDLLTQSASNYGYDEIGNLSEDAQEEISSGGIVWSVYGKIKNIIHTSGTSNKDDLEFAYDASGNRVEKIVKGKTSGALKDEVDWTSTYYVRDASGNVMATYNRTYVHGAGSNYTDNFALAEQNIYGSSRVGMRNAESTEKVSLAFTSSGFTSHKFTGESYTIPSPGTYSATVQEYFAKLGLKSYELGNHLGNVLSTISDRKIENNSSGTTISSFRSEITSTSDYYSFGAPMPGRTYVGSSTYRYNFNGKEEDPETVGTGGGTQDYGMRIYNPSLGRFLSVDPIAKQYPELTPYQFASNRPIDGIDLDGLEWKDNKGNTLSDNQLKKVKVYIFYNSKPSGTTPGHEGGFLNQTMQQYTSYEAQYGKGAVAISDANTETQFKEDWGNIDGSPEIVAINHHGSNQQIHLNSATEDYITSTGTRETNLWNTPATNVEELPQPKASLEECELDINSCHSNESDVFLERSASKKTLAKSFADTFDFKFVRGTKGSVNYEKNGSASTQWYYGKFWDYLAGKSLKKANASMENVVAPKSK